MTEMSRNTSHRRWPLGLFRNFNYFDL